MNTLNSSLIAAGLLLAGPAGAATITTSFSWVVGATIPDNNSSGRLSSQTVAVNIASIDLITVTLQTTGGWNGDLYAYVQHSSGFSVLLNRPGRTLAQPAGSAGSGMNVLIADAATQELHAIPAAGTATGNWQPDARNIDPSVVLDTSPRTSMLSAFNGLDPNGTWNLFIADLAAGDVASLTGWGISVTGTAVPEPGTSATLALGALLAAARRRRVRRN